MAKKKEFEDTIPDKVRDTYDLLGGTFSDEEMFMLAFLIGDEHLLQAQHSFHGSGSEGRYACGGYADGLALLAKTAAEVERAIEDRKAKDKQERSNKAKALAAARKKKPTAA